MGGLILYASFAVVPFFLSFKKRSRLVITVWAMIGVHAAIAAYNAYGSTIHCVEVDAMKFHAGAAAMATIGGWEFGLGARSPAGIPRFLLILYFSMSLLWAMGTINYGTAMRHHIVPFWILVVLGAPPKLDRFARLFRIKLR